MVLKIELQPAWVLHSQPFQNTSLLVDFFCLELGRVRAIAKGARRPTAKNKALLQSFQPLLISLTGRNDLKTLTAVEISHAAIALQGTRLFSGLYLNELLVRLLLSHEAHPDLYRSYQQAIIGLSGDRDVMAVLRRFELDLLEALGYGLNLHEDCRTGEPIAEQGHYLYIPEEGLERVARPLDARDSANLLFSGEQILALRTCDFAGNSHGRAALRLTRLALQRLLGDKPLASRELFQALRPLE